MKERCKVLKNIYPNYVIYDKKAAKCYRGNIKYKIHVEGMDKRIIDTFGRDNVNYIVLNGLDIEKKKECEDNKYDEYYQKLKLIDIVLLMKGRIKKYEKEKNNN